MTISTTIYKIFFFQLVIWLNSLKICWGKILCITLLYCYCFPWKRTFQPIVPKKDKSRGDRGTLGRFSTFGHRVIISSHKWIICPWNGRVRYKGLFRISCRGGGYPFLTRFPRRGMNILQRCWGGGFQFFICTKKQNMAKCSFRAIHPADFVRFAPAALKIFLHPGGYPFLTESPRGGMRFLRALFPKKGPPPP